MCKVLQFNDPMVKQALKHEALKGKKLIGRGAFSMVFEGSKPNTVYKVTLDDVNYWMLNCCAAGVSHKHFPKVYNNFGAIGDVSINKNSHTIFMYEMERLNKLERGTEASNVSTILTKLQNASFGNVFKYGPINRALFQIQDMMQSKSLPKSIMNALRQLEEFAYSYEHIGLDMHRANFMMRKNGTLVLSDPLNSMKIIFDRRQQLKNRGY